VDWVRMGYLIWRSEGWCYKRDHFPLCPNSSLDGPSNKPMTPTLMQSFFLGLLANLRVPQRPTLLAGWTESQEEDDFLIPSDLVFFWTGHSARRWLPSVATAMGYGKDLVDYVGRWGAAQHQSRDYVVTARQVVLQVQEGVVEALCTGSKPYDELDLECGFLGWASNRKPVMEGDFKLNCLLKSSASGNFSLMQSYPNFQVTGHYGAGADSNPMPFSSEAGEKSSSSSQKTEESPFWVSVTGRSCFRRLHKRNAAHCGIMPWNCKQVIDIWEVTPEVADAICKACQRSMPSSEQKTDDDSSSSGSSSSQSRATELGAVVEPLLQPQTGTSGSVWSVADPALSEVVNLGD
jgi:hypothetical protein